MSFGASVTARYTSGPEELDGEVTVRYQSARPEKRLAELAVLKALFLAKVEAEVHTLQEATNHGE